MFMRTLLCFSLFSYVFVMNDFLLILLSFHVPLPFSPHNLSHQTNRTFIASLKLTTFLVPQLRRKASVQRSNKEWMTTLQEMIFGTIRQQARQEVVALLRRQLHCRGQPPRPYSEVCQADLDHGIDKPLTECYYWRRTRHGRPLCTTDHQLVVVAPEAMGHSDSWRSLTSVLRQHC